MTEKVLCVNKLTGEKIYQYPHIIELFDNLQLPPSERAKTTTAKEAK